MKLSPWGGLLRLHGQDIARLQRLLDPLVLTLLFLWFDLGGKGGGSDAWLPFWVLVPLTVPLILSRAGLYTSYRHRSLRVLIRRITTSWLLVLSLLLTAAFLSKSSASFSRLSSSLWAFSGYLWLYPITCCCASGCDGIEVREATAAQLSTGVSLMRLRLWNNADQFEHPEECLFYRPMDRLLAQGLLRWFPHWL